MPSQEFNEILELVRALPDRSGQPYPERREEFETLLSQFAVAEGVT